MEIQNPKQEQPQPTKTVKGAARETLYRVTIPNQLRSISIADQKANIIIGVNTILMSIFIAVLGIESSILKLSFISQLNLSIPLTMLIMGSFGSGIIAIFVVRPAARLWKQKTPSRLFFRDYRHTTLEDFQKDMEDLLSSRTNIYESLNIDMYLYGQTVHRKFRLLRYAYLAFLVGLVLSAGSFLVLQII